MIAIANIDRVRGRRFSLNIQIIFLSLEIKLSAKVNSIFQKQLNQNDRYYYGKQK